MLIIVLYAQGTRQKSYGPILNLPILTDTDSNRFLRILTLPIPIPILIHKYHTDTDTDFLKNTDIPIPIPIIPIIGPSLTMANLLAHCLGTRLTRVWWLSLLHR